MDAYLTIKCLMLSFLYVKMCVFFFLFIYPIIFGVMFVLLRIPILGCSYVEIRTSIIDL